MAVITKGLIKMGNASTRRLMTYEEFIDSYKKFKAEKAKLIAQAK